MTEKETRVKMISLSLYCRNSCNIYFFYSCQLVCVGVPRPLRKAFLFLAPVSAKELTIFAREKCQEFDLRSAAIVLFSI